MLVHTALDHRTITDAEWIGLVKKSIKERVIDGITFPSFPADEVQNQFVGSANESSIEEAGQFYTLSKGYASALGITLQYDQSKILDFGCGWGRFLRLFWRDVSPENLFGVDIDPDIIAKCRQMGVQADLRQIDPWGALPFPDESFSLIFAYSVFTHLPEKIHINWLTELARVARPGCIFICTTEPRRFLDFIAGIPADAPSGWHAGLRSAAWDINILKAKFDAGQFVYIPTGGGDHRDASIYGDSIIPLSYIKKRWGRYFSYRDYIEDRFWQAVVIMQKS